MNVDIAICTWNRAKLLHSTLQSIGNAKLPPGVTVRIIVVDNNSDDDTVSCVQQFASTLDGQQWSLRLEHESQQGHTFSRNKAIAVSDSELMIWTDDDVVVDTGWVAAYVEASSRTKDSFWGGKIFPKFGADKPAWIEENWEVLKGCFAARDLGDSPIELTANRLPYGANFAIRTEIQKQFPFNNELGRRKNKVLGDDEIELFQRLLRSNHTGSWVPSSRLDHIIPDDRATESYVRNYFVGQGRALVAKGETWSASSRKLYWQMAYEFAAYRFQRQWAKSPAWMAHLIRSGLAEGQYVEMAELSGA